MYNVCAPVTHKKATGMTLWLLTAIDPELVFHDNGVQGMYHSIGRGVIMV